MFEDGNYNLYTTYHDNSESPYKEAESLKDDDIKEAGATYEGMKYVSFADGFISVSEKDPETNQVYGKDEAGDPIKKGVVNEKIISSWYGLTEGVLVTGTEDISSLRTKATPYVFPIPSDRIMSSGGILSNDGYAIRNK